MAERKATNASGGGAARAPGAEAQPARAHDRSGRAPAELRNVSFAVSMRGYDRAAVDAYVQRANRLIAELEVTRSPQAAVRHAVERVSEQTKTILDEARESAERIGATAREEADAINAAAKAEAAGLVVNASDEARRIEEEARQLMARTEAESAAALERAKANAEELRRQTKEELAVLREQAEARRSEIAADTDAVREERQKLLDDLGRMAEQLHEAASAAAARFAPEAPGEPRADEEQTAIVVPDEALDVAEGHEGKARTKSSAKKS